MEEVVPYITFHTTKEEEEDTNVPLPGFRFHPTDEELVGFYLQRKIENKKIALELIKPAEIYKHDPWDLPKLYNSIGDNKEWYFYCKRGRKYKNSVRPNRVTSSGFWKATGIDKPVRGSGGEDAYRIVGLKKSLVYYRRNSGKGTKTDWMMHEFRLPPSCPPDSNAKNASTHIDAFDQEAEVWTLCRVFKRNTTTSNHKKSSPDSKRSIITTKASTSKTCSSSNNNVKYFSFDAGIDPLTKKHIGENPVNDMDYTQYFSENSSSSSSLAGDHRFSEMLSHVADYNWEEDLRWLASWDAPSFLV